MSRPTSKFLLYIFYFTGVSSGWEESYWSRVPSVSAAPEEISSSRIDIDEFIVVIYINKFIWDDGWFDVTT